MNTVPKSITPELKSFCQSISSDRPVYIRSKRSSDAQASACFDNVARKISRAGGSIAYGWAIWQIPGLYFEAEHHGVWRNRRGDLLDVSPQLGDVAKILFLPDAAAVYDPSRFRSNVIAPASNSPVAIEFVAMAKARNAILDRYRTDEYIAVTLSAADQAALDAITLRLNDLWKSFGK
ncbi:hypothetical protein [Novosphingobium jiangmenense]|uniref:Uncharacterized protein n=1 Tax=Novosphingobium jiangmenense TaxID=2791981 RepID=A0ABS0HI85_9SPHN|nr:hypothetical protein [Novosphingobium jiangmenense]MBF9151686.1 hypothetical protein [Novosphingobium jiangmenense]